MLNNKVNAQQGFHPRRCGSPQMRYPPNRYCVIIALSAGRYGGTGTVPSILLPVLLIHILIKGIFRAIFLVFIPQKDPHSII
jgi:hypothetical protein